MTDFETPFGIFVRDATPGRAWVVAVGMKPDIDRLFDWCCDKFGLPSYLWMSIVHTQDGATFMEVHLRDEALLAALQADHEQSFLPNRFEPVIEADHSHLPAGGQLLLT